MDRTALLEHVRDVLYRGGFYVSELYSMHSTGFDLVARRDDTLLIIKVLTNIDSLSENIAKELQTLSFLLKASPILIGEKNGVNTLENDVVYFRFGIQAITLETLKNHILEGIPVKIYAGPGGLYVNLDQEKIHKLRREKNISLGSFARQVHVSRRTVQMYEEGMNARIEIASRIEELFENTVTLPVELFSHSITDSLISSPRYAELKKIRDLQQEIFFLLQKVGYKIIPMDRCPFEALSKDKEKILLTCVHKYDKQLIKKAQIVNSISKITEKHGVVITDKEVNRTNVEGTPLIMKKELKKIRDPEDVYTLILERQ